MAHPAQREFFAAARQRWPELFTGVSVLEVGSLDINGTVRDFFDATRYVGVDLGPGPGVDVVVDGEQDLPFTDGEFDVAVSAECFEHDPYWRKDFAEMCRVARLAVVFSCASYNRSEHGTSRSTPSDSPLTVAAGWEYYQNLGAGDFEEAFDLDAVFAERHWQQELDLYFVGIKWRRGPG